MKKIIPPFLFLLSILIMIGLNLLKPEFKFLDTPFNYYGIPIVLIGLIMTFQVRKLFEKKDTEIHTFKKPRSLVTSGLFQISRNPIYLGFSISLIGVSLIVANSLSIIGFMFFFFATNFWYIPYEEKIMEKEFGAEYLKYKSEVRRWI